MITVIDAAHGEATLDAQPEAVKQAAVADRLVLTKSDLTSSARIAVLWQRLRMLNPGALLIPARDGGIAPKLLLGLRPFQLDAKIGGRRSRLVFTTRDLDGKVIEGGSRAFEDAAAAAPRAAVAA